MNCDRYEVINGVSFMVKSLFFFPSQTQHRVPFHVKVDLLQAFHTQEDKQSMVLT